MERRTIITQLKPNLYLLDDAHTSSGYLVIGSEKALLIDTMNGLEDLHKIVRELTDKPLIVVNTHGHPDHVHGNIFFDSVYMNSKDLPVVKATGMNQDFWDICNKFGKYMPPFQEVKEGDVFELGGRTLEVFELPGHTPGGIVLLLREDRILFVGDSINHHLWMQLEGCLTPREYVKELDRLLFLEDKADVILHGHAGTFDDISLMRCLRDGMQEIADGLTAMDEPYEWFGGVGKQHHFALKPEKSYSQEHSVICYDPNNMHVK